VARQQAAVNERLLDTEDSLLAPGAPLAERAYSTLKDWLLGFELMPGDRLSETDLSARLSISRTPVRQALQKLQLEGFVDTVPRLGWMVAPLRFDRIDALYEFRTLIETDALARLCTQPQARRLLAGEFSVWCSEPDLRQVDAPTVGSLDERFHMTLVKAAGNEEILKTHREITEKIRIVRRLDFTQAERVDATYREHAAILEAVANGQADEAQRLMRAHIEQSRQAVREITLEMLYRARPERRP
jgi:DNA-binding GntR family transcriptional regulator